MRMLVGSPTMHPSGRNPRFCKSVIINGAPAQPISSSKESAKWIGRASFVACIFGSRVSAAPINPFMSHVPRPYKRPSRISGLNGSLSHFWPSTGTTSVCPDNTMPPFVAPSCAGTVANRLAHLPVGSVVSVLSIPAARRSSRTVSIRPMFGLRLTVSKETSFLTHGNDAGSEEGVCATEAADSAIWDMTLSMEFFTFDHTEKTAKIPLTHRRTRQCAGLNLGETLSATALRRPLVLAAAPVRRAPAAFP